jgi:hypothetical protein
MFKEYIQVRNRLDNLRYLLFEDLASLEELPELEKDDLKRQHHYMTEYVLILERRALRQCDDE